MIRDAVVEERGQGAEGHAREDPAGGALDSVGSLVRTDVREPAISKLRHDRRVHEKQLGLAVPAYDGEAGAIGPLAIDDMRDRVRHVDIDVYSGPSPDRARP